MKFQCLVKAAIAAAVMAASCVSANASVYEFSYTFVDGGNLDAGKITGTFTGTGPVTDITNIANVNAALNGTTLGPLNVWSYTPSSPNCGAADCYTFGNSGAVVSSIGLSNNFVSSASPT